MHSTAANGLVNGAKETGSMATNAPVEEDRYSALKDLDALFTTAKAEPAPSSGSPWTPMWSSATNQPTQSNQVEANASGTRAETKTAWNTAFPSSTSNPFLG